jgi:hypothetical protein
VPLSTVSLRLILGAPRKRRRCPEVMVGSIVSPIVRAVVNHKNSTLHKLLDFT